ncbi:hypothetical protein DIS18_10395 [Algibacter marinivivus]|uniref:Outer membrane protein beta-barrel domain-containing protein n=1 Tax=Algibacter marinivivus TaxID=2100723 RepID=A0A2U2X4E8_9FLAO|nr:outer membrane beta-barrel protein [Algibacter marinivivus]PWH82639.1 hypothetical protein DIS18_10395 [Algibacter marinivivus]
MKKLILLAVVAVFAIGSMNAQGNFRAGLNGGIPIGDAGDLATFAIAIDLGYILEISDGFDAGVETGYTNYFGKDNFDDFNFIPVNGVANFDLSDDFSAEAGAGIAFSLETNGGSDFYWKFGFAYDLDEDSDLGLSYRSVSGGNGFSIDGIFLGYRRSF